MELLFFSVFISSEQKDKTVHRRWFFEILRDGTRSSSDWQVLKNMDLFNLFLVIFKCGHQKDRVIFKNITNIFVSIFIIVLVFILVIDLENYGSYISDSSCN